MKTIVIIAGARRFFTELKSHNGNILYEVECLGMVWYEIHYYKHERTNRHYNYFTALTHFKSL